jgi:hypothetical protein
MRGGKIEFGDVGNRPYQVVLRVGELRRGFRATAHADERMTPFDQRGMISRWRARKNC